MSPARSSANCDTESAPCSANAEQASGSARGPAAQSLDDDNVWADILARCSELREFASYLVAANLDRLRLTVRTAVVWSVLGVVLGLFAGGVIAAASVLLVIGLSNAVGQLLGGRIWLGQLVVSGVILIAASGGVWLVLRRGLRAYQRSLIDKYERRKQFERTEYGTDVEQRAETRPQETRPAVE